MSASNAPAWVAAVGAVLLVVVTLGLALVTAVLVGVTTWLAWETRKFRSATAETKKQQLDLMSYPVLRLEYKRPKTVRVKTPAHDQWYGFLMFNLGAGVATLETMEPEGYAERCGDEIDVKDYEIIPDRELPRQLPCVGFEKYLEELYGQGRENLPCTVVFRSRANVRYRQHFRLKVKCKVVVALACERLGDD